MPKSKMDKIVRVTDIHLIPIGSYEMESGAHTDDAWMVVWKDSGRATFKVVPSREEAETERNYLEVLGRAIQPQPTRAEQRRAERAIRELERAVRKYERPTRVRRHVRRL